MVALNSAASHEDKVAGLIMVDSVIDPRAMPSKRCESSVKALAGSKSVQVFKHYGFLAATLPTIPPNWTDLRSNWEMGLAIRFALQFAALSLLILSLALDANTISHENK
jgi:hypothetical protein